jgi:MFS family permease
LWFVCDVSDHLCLPALPAAAAVNDLVCCSIQLSQDLNLSSTVYGLGSGAFFLAYALGQLPSNFLLLRFGGPAWLSAITVVWGLAASVSATKCETCCKRANFQIWTCVVPLFQMLVNMAGG